MANRYLVVGGQGMLGTDVVEHLKSRGFEVSAPTLEELDITNPESIAKLVSGDFGQFDWCINCAAYTAVDKAETERMQAVDVNVFGASYLARACSGTGTGFVHVSTDFVFDGEATSPYPEDTVPHPIGFYGESKRDGEIAVQQAHQNAYVVRTSWLYGVHGASFPRTMIRAWEAGKDLKVVADQTGNPTNTVDLARVLIDLTQTPAFPGIYHAVGPESMTWHDFAQRAITAYRDFKRSAQPVEIAPIKTKDWPTPAKRPKYSVLSTAKIDALGINPMRSVEESLRHFVASLGAP